MSQSSIPAIPCRGHRQHTPCIRKAGRGHGSGRSHPPIRSPAPRNPEGSPPIKVRFRSGSSIALPRPGGSRPPQGFPAIIVLLKSIVHLCREGENAEQERRHEEDQEGAERPFEGEPLMLASSEERRVGKECVSTGRSRCS